MANTIHNERIKAAAGLLNSAANTCFGIGIAAPIVASYFSGALGWAVMFGVITWAPAVAFLHYRAWRILGRLTDDEFLDFRFCRDADRRHRRRLGLFSLDGAAVKMSFQTYWTIIPLIGMALTVPFAQEPGPTIR